MFEICVYCNDEGRNRITAEVCQRHGACCSTVKALSALHFFMKEHQNLHLVLLDEETFPRPAFNILDMVAKYRRTFHVQYLSPRMELSTNIPQEHQSVYRTICAELEPLCKTDGAGSTDATVRKTAYELITAPSANFHSQDYKRLLQEFSLKPSHARVLAYFHAHHGQNITLEELSALFWDDSRDHTQTLYTYIHQLRKCLPRLNPSARIVRTGHGLYRFSIS